MHVIIYMKRLSIIALVFFFLVPTSVFAAKDTFSKRYKNKTVKEVLADLKETTGTRVSYKRKEVNNARRVTVSFHNATPEEVINELFDCEYSITKKGKKGKIWVQPIRHKVLLLRPSSVCNTSNTTTPTTSK